MKKILVLLLIIAGAGELKAQQPVPVPANPLLPNNFKGIDIFKFKATDSALYRSLLKPQKNDPLTLLQPIKGNEKYAEVFYNRMPVAGLTSNDKMPVVKAPNNDPMPVKRYRSVDPLAVIKPVTP